MPNERRWLSLIQRISSDVPVSHPTTPWTVTTFWKTIYFGTGTLRRRVLLRLFYLGKVLSIHHTFYKKGWYIPGPKCSASSYAATTFKAELAPRYKPSESRRSYTISIDFSSAICSAPSSLSTNVPRLSVMRPWPIPTDHKGR
jgi:hypothetical protein